MPFYTLILSKELDSSELNLELKTFKYGKLIGNSKVIAHDLTTSSFGILELHSVISDIRSYDIVEVILKGLEHSSF